MADQLVYEDGLMEKIQTLTAPPQSTSGPKHRGKKPKPVLAVRHGSIENNSYCDACGDGGDLLCCDKCPSSFHFGCCDPPMDRRSLPSGEWLCRRCESLEVNERVPQLFRPLLETACSANPLVFNIPIEMQRYETMPGGSRKYLPQKTAQEREEESLKFCYACNRSFRHGCLVSCDFCPLVFHLDCLSPPLTNPPTSIWMCPMHPHAKTPGFSHPRLTERLRAMSECGSDVDHHTVKMAFLSRINSIPHYKRLTQHHNRRVTEVPPAVKALYSSPLSDVHESPTLCHTFLTPMEGLEWRWWEERERQEFAVPREPVFTEDQDEWTRRAVQCQLEQNQSPRQPSTITNVTTTNKPLNSANPSLRHEPESAIDDGKDLSTGATFPDFSVFLAAHRLMELSGKSPLPNGVTKAYLRRREGTQEMGREMKHIDERTEEEERELQRNVTDAMEVDDRPSTLDAYSRLTSQGSSPQEQKISNGCRGDSCSNAGHEGEGLPRTVAVENGEDVGLTSDRRSLGVPAAVGRGRVCEGGGEGEGGAGEGKEKSTEIEGEEMEVQECGEVKKEELSPGAELGGSVRAVTTEGEDNSQVPDVKAGIRTPEKAAETTVKKKEEEEEQGTLFEPGFVPDISHLDERLIRLLATQRIQQLFASSTENKAGKGGREQVDGPSLPRPLQSDPSPLPTNRHLNGLKPAPVSSGGPAKAILSSEVFTSSPAVLCPVSGVGSAYPFQKFVTSIGTGSEMDICLPHHGHCNYISPRHACIFFDKATEEYELMNYSDHGSVVDGVLYSCDFSDKPCREDSFKSYHSPASSITPSHPPPPSLTLDDLRALGTGLRADRARARLQATRKNLEDLERAQKALEGALKLVRPFSREGAAQSESTLGKRTTENSSVVSIPLSKTKKMCTVSISPKKANSHHSNPVKASSNLKQVSHQNASKPPSIVTSSQKSLQAPHSTAPTTHKSNPSTDEPSAQPRHLHSLQRYQKPCVCKRSASSLVGSNGKGWEGTALLCHGSRVRFGCVQFVLSIAGRPGHSELVRAILELRGDGSSSTNCLGSNVT